MIELPNAKDSILERHHGATRVILRGDPRIAEAYVKQAQVYMGWLRHTLAMGGIGHGVRHIALPNGVKIRVLFDGAMNLVEIYAPPLGGAGAEAEFFFWLPFITTPRSVDIRTGQGTYPDVLIGFRGVTVNQENTKRGGYLTSFYDDAHNTYAANAVSYQSKYPNGISYGNIDWRNEITGDVLTWHGASTRYVDNRITRSYGVSGLCIGMTLQGSNDDQQYRVTRVIAQPPQGTFLSNITEVASYANVSDAWNFAILNNNGHQVTYSNPSGRTLFGAALVDYQGQTYIVWAQGKRTVTGNNNEQDYFYVGYFNRATREVTERTLIGTVQYDLSTGGGIYQKKNRNLTPWFFSGSGLKAVAVRINYDVNYLAHAGKPTYFRYDAVLTPAEALADWEINITQGEPAAYGVREPGSGSGGLGGSAQQTNNRYLKFWDYRNETLVEATLTRSQTSSETSIVFDARNRPSPVPEGYTDAVHHRLDSETTTRFSFDIGGEEQWSYEFTNSASVEYSITETYSSDSWAMDSGTRISTFKSGFFPGVHECMAMDLRSAFCLFEFQGRSHAGSVGTVTYSGVIDPVLGAELNHSQSGYTETYRMRQFTRTQPSEEIFEQISHPPSTAVSYNVNPYSVVSDPGGAFTPDPGETYYINFYDDIAGDACIAGLYTYFRASGLPLLELYSMPFALPFYDSILANHSSETQFSWIHKESYNNYLTDGDLETLLPLGLTGRHYMPVSVREPFDIISET